jgi:hypothetical protein
LKLVSQQAWGASNLLVEGDRALVIFAGRGVMAPGGAVTPGPYPEPINEGPRYVLVDLSRSPKVLGTLTPTGDYLDARLVGSTVRLVVRSQPNLAVPQPGGASDDTQQLAQASAAVRRAPITAKSGRARAARPTIVAGERRQRQAERLPGQVAIAPSYRTP